MLLNSTPISIDYYGFYCSGGGYFVQKDILLLCLDKYIELYPPKSTIACDMLMGNVLNELDILPKHINYFDLKILDWNEPESSSYYFWYWRKLLE